MIISTTAHKYDALTWFCCRYLSKCMMAYLCSLEPPLLMQALAREMLSGDTVLPVNSWNDSTNFVLSSMAPWWLRYSGSVYRASTMPTGSGEGGSHTHTHTHTHTLLILLLWLIYNHTTDLLYTYLRSGSNAGVCVMWWRTALAAQHRTRWYSNQIAIFI